MTTPPVSLLLTMYQHEAYVREAVRAALAQDYQPLEIILSDDASSDATFEIAKEEADRYRGPHRVVLNRNPFNLQLDHLNKALGLVNGRLLVRAHGDDIAHPDRTRRLVAAWTAWSPSLVTSNAELITAEGEPLGLRSTETRSGWVVMDDLIEHGNMPTAVGCTFMVDRAVYEEFPRIGRATHPLLLDQIIPFRAALLNGVYYLAQPLLKYRQHDRSMSSLIADRVGSQDAYYETACGQYVWAQLCRLDELAHFRRRRPDQPRLVEIRQKLELKIISLTGAWIGYRRDLLARDLRPEWLERNAFEHRAVGAAAAARPPSPAAMPSAPRP